MRYVLHALWFIPAMLAAGLVWGVSATVNWRFGLSLGTDEAFNFFLIQVTTAEVYSAASFAMDILKTCLPFALLATIQAKMHRASMALLAALVFSVIWSLSSALGFAALNHSATTDLRGKDVIGWTQLTGEIARLEQRRAWIPEARPLAAVEAERIGLENHYLFGQTKRCTNATLPGSVEHCDRWRSLKIEEGNAAELVRIDTDLAERRAEMKDTPKVTSESPRDEMFSYATGLEKQSIAAGYGIFFALMIEAIASVGFWALCMGFAGATRKPVRIIPIEIKPVQETQKISEEALEIEAKEPDAVGSAIPDFSVPESLPEPDKKVHKLQLAVVRTTRGRFKRLAGNAEVDKITRLWVDQCMDRVDVDRDGGAANVLHENYDEFCRALPEPVEGVNVSQLGKSVRRLEIATKRTDEAAQWGLRPKVKGGASRAGRAA